MTCILVLILTGCQSPTPSNSELANKFIDTFYSFNRDSLQSILSQATHSQPNIFYYQKWAECANYKVLERDKFTVLMVNDHFSRYRERRPDGCTEDQLQRYRHLQDHDTRRAHPRHRNIVERLAHYYEAKEWVKQQRPELVDKACEGIWEGGPTPCECVRDDRRVLRLYRTKE